MVASFHAIIHISGLAPVQYTQSCSLYPWTSLNSPVKSKVCLRISRRFQHHHRLGWMLTCSSLGLKLILSNERLPDNRIRLWPCKCLGTRFSILRVIYVDRRFYNPCSKCQSSPSIPRSTSMEWGGIRPRTPRFSRVDVDDVHHIGVPIEDSWDGSASRSCYCLLFTWRCHHWGQADLSITFSSEFSA